MLKYALKAGHPAIAEGVLQRRQYVCDDIRSIDEEKRLIDFTISTDREDRYGDSVQVNGWQLAEYKRNPVVLFAHNNYIPPVGQSIKIWKDTALKSTCEFMDRDTSPFAYSIFRMYVGRYLRAVSVGFIPIKWEYIEDDDKNITGYRFLKQELLEYSCVPIPANPDALIDARSKGIDTAPIAKWAGMVLDDWKTVGDEINVIYGADRAKMEQVRRTAAGAGVTIHLPPDMEARLRESNLNKIRAQKSQQEPTMANPKTAADFKALLDGLPVTKAPEHKDAEELIVANEGGKIILGKDLPKKTLITTEALTDRDGALGNKVIDVDVTETGEGKDKMATTTLTVKGANLTAVYKVLSHDPERKALVAELQSSKAVETKTPSAPAPKDPKDETDKGTRATPAGSSVDIFIVHTNKDGGAEELRVDGKVVDTKAITERKATDLEVVGVLETVLNGLEAVLDKGALKAGGDKQLARRLKFNAGFMRDLADLIDPAGKVSRAAGTTLDITVPTEAGDVDTFIKSFLEGLGPKIDELVKTALDRQRGKLD